MNGGGEEAETMTGLRRRPPVVGAVRVHTRTGQAGLLAGVALAGLLGLAIIHNFSPSAHGFYPQCGLHSWTGLHCPGCGSLRAVYLLTHGEWLAALHSNALLVLTGAALVVWGMARWRKGQAFRWEVHFSRPGVLWGLAGLCLLFGILRNLPWYPFTLLAP